jgi:tetratricopeptide (TPR) repeat protein
VYRGAGRPRRALVSAQKALGFARRAGDRRLEGELQARLGVHLLDLDRVEEAERELRDALLTATEIEDRRSESLARCFLGILLAEQEHPEGPEQLERGRRLAHEIGQARTEAVCTAILARVHFAEDPGAALALSGSAVELLGRAGAELLDRIVIRGTHAMVLSRLGHAEEAEEQVGELRRRIRAANGRIESPLLQRRHRLATRQLLAAALSPEGPVYRRVRLQDAPPAGHSPGA